MNKEMAGGKSLNEMRALHLPAVHVLEVQSQELPCVAGIRTNDERPAVVRSPPGGPVGSGGGEQSVLDGEGSNKPHRHVVHDPFRFAVVEHVEGGVSIEHCSICGLLAHLLVEFSV